MSDELDPNFLYLNTSGSRGITYKIEKRIVRILGFDPDTLNADRLWHIIYLCLETPIPPLELPLDRSTTYFIDNREDEWVAAVRKKLDALPPPVV